MFTCQGTTFTSCTTEKDRLPWCATKVDQDGNYIEDHWDFCSFVDPIEDPIDPLRPITTWGGGEECENPCSGQKCDEVVAKYFYIFLP